MSGSPLDLSTGVGAPQVRALSVERATYTNDRPTRPEPAELYGDVLGTTEAGSTAFHVAKTP